MQKDIDLQQIISVLNQSTIEQEHTSFRLSDDYQPNYYRYSKEEELQEITFNLTNDEDDSFLGSSVQNDLKITEENPHQKLAFILQEESNQQSVKPQVEQPLTLIKKGSLSRKTSIKASQLLKRKISLKKETDEFTKKYDDLFDEIFFKEKSKQIKNNPIKQPQQDKKESSLASTSNQNLSNSNVSSENNFSISRAIDEALISGFNSQSNIQHNNANPKVNITYETKIVINIRPPKELMAEPPIETNLSKPKIKFSYGQTEPLFSSKKQISLENVPYHIHQQRRLPRFMLSFRNITNNYPNFYSKVGFTEENCTKVNKQFVDILSQCKKSIKSLKQSHLTLHDLFTNIRQLYKLMSINILNHDSKQDNKLIDYFLGKDWVSYLKTDELQAIKPRDYFLNRPFNELQFITFINSFEEIVVKLESQALLNSENPQSIKAYINGRDQLWGIQKNLRLLSQDLYVYSISHFNLPGHFMQSHKLLKSLRNKENITFEAKHERLLKNILFLQEKKDVFGSSWLGIYTIECLCSLKK